MRKMVLLLMAVMLKMCSTILINHIDRVVILTRVIKIRKLFITIIN